MKQSQHSWLPHWCALSNLRAAVKEFVLRCLSCSFRTQQHSEDALALLHLSDATNSSSPLKKKKKTQILVCLQSASNRSYLTGPMLVQFLLSEIGGRESRLLSLAPQRVKCTCKTHNDRRGQRPLHLAQETRHRSVTSHNAEHFCRLYMLLTNCIISRFKKTYHLIQCRSVCFFFMWDRWWWWGGQALQSINAKLILPKTK